MNGAAAPAPRSDGRPETAPAFLTTVELTWIEKAIEYWIRFGEECHEQILDRRRRRLGFAPGAIFAFVRWASNGYGTVTSRIDIVRAVGPGEAFQTLMCVRPGGDILLRLAGWSRVERVLQAIDAIEAQGLDPAQVSPDHWRHIHSRMTAGQEPRRYTIDQHRAFLLRRRTMP